MKAKEARDRWDEGNPAVGYIRGTEWSFDGTVNHQWRFNLGVQIKQDRREPPWWWNVKDQTGPSAPWWHEKATLKNGHHEYVDAWGHKVRGPFTETRRANEPRQWVFYYVDSGFKAEEGEEAGKLTRWNFDGTVRHQWPSDNQGRFTPPWLWGVKDQTVLTAPWWNEKDK